MFRRLRLDRCLLALASVHSASAASAADYRVTTYSDPVPDFCVTIDCSLREAVRAANQGGSADRIFLSAGTYTLSQSGADEDAALTGDLDISNDLEIIGAGATMTHIDAAGLDRVIHVLGAGTSVRIQDVSILGGSGAPGGGVSVDAGSATIERVEIHGNSGPNGVPPGGLRVVSTGSLVLRESTLESNARRGRGPIASRDSWFGAFGVALGSARRRTARAFRRLSKKTRANGAPTSAASRIRNGGSVEPPEQARRARRPRTGSSSVACSGRSARIPQPSSIATDDSPWSRGVLGTPALAVR